MTTLADAIRDNPVVFVAVTAALLYSVYYWAAWLIARAVRHDR